MRAPAFRAGLLLRWTSRRDPADVTLMVVGEISRDARCPRSRQRQGGPPLRRTVRAMPDAWVYLLRCRVGSLYIGWTVDLERRLARHRSSVASRYTASRLPVELTDLQEALHYAAEAVRERELPLAG